MEYDRIRFPSFLRVCYFLENEIAVIFLSAVCRRDGRRVWRQGLKRAVIRPVKIICISECVKFDDSLFHSFDGVTVGFARGIQNAISE